MLKISKIQILSIMSLQALSLLMLDRDSLAQGSFKPPERQQVPRAVPRERVPAETPPNTFGTINPPPSEGYSPIPFEERKSRQFNLYRLDIGDAIAISVTEFPEFNFQGPIDADGNIVVPILGRVSIAGLTLEEVESKISYELTNRFLRTEPEVISTLLGERPIRLTILGEIVRPGFYTVGPGALLTEVLNIAGGSTGNADLRSIIVRRNLVDGSVLEQEIDLYTPLISGNSVPRVRLQGGDTVIVSRLQVGTDEDYDRFLVARTTVPQQQITIRLLVPLIPSGRALRNIALENGSTFLDIIATLPTSDVLRINVNQIALLRFDPEKGGIVTQTLNPGAALRGDISQNIPLQDDDVVIVSRTLLGEVFAAINILTQPIRDVQSFTRFFSGFDRNF